MAKYEPNLFSPQYDPSNFLHGWIIGFGFSMILLIMNI